MRCAPFSRRVQLSARPALGSNPGHHAALAECLPSGNGEDLNGGHEGAKLPSGIGSGEVAFWPAEMGRQRTGSFRRPESKSGRAARQG